MTNIPLIHLKDGLSIPLFIIHGGIPFELVYLATFLTGIVGLTAIGVYKKYPAGTWATIVTTVVVSFITGLILFSYPINAWPAILFGDYQQIHYLKFVPGGILFAIFALLIIRKVLRFKPSVGDSFILILPMLAIIQRVGCLVNGCCYGKPTDLPWAVEYPAAHALHQIQIDQGLIDQNSLFCQGVHPTQLYMISGYLIALVILVITRNKFQIPGTRSLFGISLLAMVRFAVEFWREPKTNVWYSVSWMGLSFLQWSIIAFVLVCSLLFYLKISKLNRTNFTANQVIELPFLNFMIITILFVIVWQLRELFDFVELLMLAGIFSFSFVVILIRIFQKITRPSLRWLSFTMMVVAFFAMSQQIIETPKDSLTTFKKSNWFGVGLNAGAGNYHEVTRDCNGNITGTYDRNYLVYGGDFSYHLIPKPNQHLTAGINVFYQEDKIEDQNFADSYQGTVFNPYFIYDFKKVGIGAGLHYSGNKFTSYDANYFAPSYYIRLGRRDKLFTEFNLMQNFYKDGASAIGQLALGGGFGQLDKNSLRCGVGFFPNSRTAFFVEGNILIQDFIYLKPGFAIGDGINGSLGLQVLLGKNRKKR
jgi:phosphatidylglycerol:prolipoprotein diacylglycerol transferase